MLRFHKMHGLSNDFVIVDLRGGERLPPRETIGALTERKTGIGCDQFIAILPGKDPRADCFMRIFNAPDGSEAEACGNATRCVASLLMREKGECRVTIQTVAGFLECRADNEEKTAVTVDMGIPSTDWRKIPLARECDTLDLPVTLPDAPDIAGCAVNVGNPHCVFFLEGVESYPVREAGPQIEHHPIYPQRTNVEFAQVLDRSRIRMRVWERDTGETQACGSAACATIVAAVRRGLTDRRCEVILNGGSLYFHWREEDDHLIMTGPVAYVFEGVATI